MLGHFDNGLRNGYGTEYHEGLPLYIGEWKDRIKTWEKDVWWMKMETW